MTENKLREEVIPFNKWSYVFYAILIIFIIICILFLTDLNPLSCHGEVVFTGILNRQYIENDMLWLNYSIETCRPISCMYCGRIYTEISGNAYKNEYDFVYFQLEKNLLIMNPGDKIEVRWCNVPLIGYRVRGVTKL